MENMTSIETKEGGFEQVKARKVQRESQMC